MTKIKNWIVLIAVFVLSFIAAYSLVNSSLFDLSKVNELGTDLQYNLISISAIIGGFLFTGVSILISALENGRVKRMWNYDYLDNIYHAAFIGIGANIITIVSALAMLFLALEEKIQDTIMKIEIISVLVGLVFFAWCVLDLVFIVSTMKTDSQSTT